MPIDIPMPRLSDTMEEGTLVKWKVKVGDKVASGDVLADVETDKATMELQTYDDGTVAKLAVAEGETAPVGKLLLVLAKPGESVEEAAKSQGGSAPAAASSGKGKAATTGENEPATADTASGGEAEESTGDTTGGTTGGRIRVSPLARKIAEDRRIDLATVKGSGPEGRIIKRDVLTASAPLPAAAKPAQKPLAVSRPAPSASHAGLPPIQPLEAKVVPVSNMRKTIARRLLESKTTIPHFTVTVAVHTDAMLALRATLNEQLAAEGVKLSVNDFIVLGCAQALLRHPVINSSWTDAGIKFHDTVNIGVAVSLSQEKGGGLVVPTLRNVQTKNLRAISSETRALADKARTKGLTIEEMSDATFTISNLGMMGVDHFEAIINPPQSAILAIGAAIKKPLVRPTAGHGDGIVIGTEMTCTLSADHRVIDGALAAEFLQTLRHVLEAPATLLV